MPSRFSRCRRRDVEATRGLSWLKDTSREVIAVMRALTEVLERCAGVRVTVLVADQPGYIVYEDDQQVVAEPFSSTITG